ncbi:hypothetical protein DW157_16950 [Bacteroides eggerthii]|uniref:Uncharacterized protein n=1 Tax=Bacteroides eggerthii TaxID=28111 RepID=A0A415RVS2_9BACE|nr:hypothetical protein DW910_13785 [Bacteroides eggerthii]RHI69707.1 hypothetical protein DW157_16950 [Bacteroides eggerthii]RHJ36853.1 hypothetical protein DW130_15325 [Bacteroides eggerthii]RHM66256.1 hypothetical protein DWZ51_14500 [Bacteroides eggerthii]RYT71626.1 hypothetical protein EAJ03_13105 [Bacteroides eggerthii]
MFLPILQEKLVFGSVFDFFKNYGWYDRFVLTAQSVSTGGKEQSFLWKQHSGRGRGQAEVRE